ncbi:universal stress protein [Halorussus halobius]|uniref:universal stress protein n=1 Tax=Halorussus halobius TaxID=1710537 RepID=UPI001092365E|nr:universal stress protein [Halorussus halobius]
MSTPTFDAILVPVASSDDARTTARALREHFDLSGTDVTFAFVVEKAGGVPDKAGVEQREAVAEDAFEAARAELTGVEVGTEITYATDVADGIRGVAADVDADAIVFVPREGGRLARFLTGDVALSLATDSDRPVVSLPTPEVGG